MALAACLVAAVCCEAQSIENESPDPLVAAKPSENTAYTYKRGENFELSLFVYQPIGQRQTDARRAAVIFFHGSGWQSGSVRQFEGYAKLLAAHGLTGILADYRTAADFNATPFEAVGDAKSAIRWVRGNAGMLHVDPHKIVAAGASSGGHIALSAAIFPQRYDSSTDDLAISARPDALILFAPVVDTTPAGYTGSLEMFQGRQDELSPMRFMQEGLPPTLVFHGASDEWVPLASIRRFSDLMHRFGNACDAVIFADRGHHFYNHPSYYRERPQLRGDTYEMDFIITFYLLERFLQANGFLSAAPAVLSPAGYLDE